MFMCDRSGGRLATTFLLCISSLHYSLPKFRWLILRPVDSGAVPESSHPPGNFWYNLNNPPNFVPETAPGDDCSGWLRRTRTQTHTQHTDRSVNKNFPFSRIPGAAPCDTQKNSRNYGPENEQERERGGRGIRRRVN